MKQKIKKWTVRITATALLIAALLLIIVLNPVLTYAGKTKHNNLTVFHNKPLVPTTLTKLEQATELLKTSEFYDPKLQLDICLNDGSKYPTLIRAIRGEAFAWGFYDKVVMQGNANFQENYVELHGYRWNLIQLVAHEMTHCLQFHKLGFLRSNPIAGIPNWKWEGYAEYISRKNADQKDLFKNIELLIATSRDNWEIKFADGTISPGVYYDSWTLIQYCMDIKKMTYQQILADTTTEQTVRQEMMAWFNSRR